MRVPWIFGVLLPADQERVRAAMARRAEIETQLRPIGARIRAKKPHPGDAAQWRSLGREWETVGKALRELEHAAIMHVSKPPRR